MSYQTEHKLPPLFEVKIDKEACRHCKRCVVNCTYDVLKHNGDRIVSKDENCVACLRCQTYCPQDAITIIKSPRTWNPHETFTISNRRGIYEQSATGGVLLSSMGLNRPYTYFFDDLVLDACQVTNPSIDPLREPVETKVFLGRKPQSLEFSQKGKNDISLKTKLHPHVELKTPIIIGHMSFGSMSYNAYLGLLRGAYESGTIMGTGEGGLHKDFYKYSKAINSEIASGRFGIDTKYIKEVAALEIKIGQGAKPGHGGHLPGEKVNETISKTRMIPEGTDALSPYPHHDIYSIEDLAQLIGALKEASEYKVPIGVKIAAVHNSAPIASGIARAGADFITIDGFRGGTGAAPRVIRDHAGIPIELALSSVDRRLREEGIRNDVTLIASGSIRSSADLVKAIALGADLCSIGTAALIAIGCRVCQTCHLGICAWGIATQRADLVGRIDPDVATQRVKNLISAWNEELREILGAMGIDSIESLKGNRERLRYVGSNPKIAEILGVAHAGE
ncbi:MAG: glutamate synthase-related protein [Candidatus Ranarchaeia archaeon]